MSKFYYTTFSILSFFKFGWFRRRLSNITQILLKVDYVLLGAIFLLNIISLLILFSITWKGQLGFQGSLIFKKQLLFTLMGLVVLLFFSSIDYRIWYNYNKVVYFIVLGLLIAVLATGSTVRGATSWFRIGIFGFEPVELTKLAVIIVMAKYLDIYAFRLHRLKYIIGSVVPVLLLMGLTFIQPDLGSFLVIGAIWIGMIVVSGIKKKHLFLILFVIISSALLAWSFVLKDYQKDRVISFLDPSKDPLGSGYNLLQSMIAVGSGEFWGHGLGQGPQSRLQFLPEEHTDFIFAVIAQDWGFVGVVLLMTVFTVLLFRIIKITLSSKNYFGRMIGVGAILMILFQLMVNVGMNIGILPITGIPLPFVSYGGSALLTLFVLVGIIQSVHINNKYKELR